jgi:hypothetical protein
MIPQCSVSITSNPHRYVGHPSGWRFVLMGDLVLAAPPHIALDHAVHVVEGVAERAVRRLLTNVPFAA